MPDYDAGDAYMNHAGGGMYGTGSEPKPTNKIAAEDAGAGNRVSPAQSWVDSMDDASLRHYLHRETKRVNELHRALGVAEDLLNALEAAAETRGIDIFG